LAVVVKDDHGADEAVQAGTVTLLTVNHVAGMIGGWNPGRALRLARTAQPYGSPVILSGEIAGPVPDDAVFTLGVRPGWRGQVLARYAYGALQAKRALVLTDEQNPVAVELATGFVQEWPTAEGAKLEQAAFPSNADLPDRMAQAAAAKPDVVLIAASAADFLKAQKELSGLKAPLFFGGEDVGVEPLETSNGDVVTAAVIAKGEWTDLGKDFAKKYQDRFHVAPDSPACLGYESARLLLGGIARANSVAADNVRRQLAATEFDGLTGPIRFKDGRARRRLFVVRLHDGEAKVVQKIDPESEPAAGGER
jgi:branched-chain amino acid transport system substrate-binding protein